MIRFPLALSQVGFPLHPVKPNLHSKACGGLVLPGRRPAEWSGILSRGTCLGRCRPKLKECRVPDTQIGFHLTTFEALQAKKVKNDRAAVRRAVTLRLSTPVITRKLYLLTKNPGKYLPNCLVGICRSTTFASAFRKEQHKKTIIDKISYRQVVRRACSIMSMSKGNTNRQFKEL